MIWVHYIESAGFEKKKESANYPSRKYQTYTIYINNRLHVTVKQQVAVAIAGLYSHSVWSTTTCVISRGTSYANHMLVCQENEGNRWHGILRVFWFINGMVKPSNPVNFGNHFQLWSHPHSDRLNENYLGGVKFRFCSVNLQKLKLPSQAASFTNIYQLSHYYD